MWYCAHAIFYYKYQGQESFLAHENIYLIDADDGDHVLDKARDIAKSNEDTNTDGHLELNGHKAQYLFAGIRKIIEVELDADTAQGRLRSGIEATYSVFEVDTIDEIQGLAKGDATTVLYRE